MIVANILTSYVDLYATGKGGIVTYYKILSHRNEVVQTIQIRKYTIR
jgi:hypothetical protein